MQDNTGLKGTSLLTAVHIRIQNNQMKIDAKIVLSDTFLRQGHTVLIAEHAPSVVRLQRITNLLQYKLQMNQPRLKNMARLVKKLDYCKAACEQTF